MLDKKAYSTIFYARRSVQIGINMSIKAVFLDLDGTLLNDEKIISQKNISTLKHFASKGIKFIVSTGRNYTGTLSVLNNINFIDYIITSNGAAVYDTHTGKPIITDFMSNGLAISLAESLDLENIMLDIFVNGEAYMEEKNIEFLKHVDTPEAIRSFILHNRIIVPSIMDYLITSKKDIEKVTINFKTLPDGTIFKRAETIDIIKSFLSLSCVTGGSNNVEVTLSEATKGHAMRKLVNLLNIPISDTAAMGDSENDLHIIETAGVGIAMGNADDMVKSAADFVTLTNEEDGVSYALENILNL